MLILTRKPGESLYIGDSIKITIVELKGHQIRVGIDAPKDMRIYREEIYVQIIEENKKAAESPQGLEVDLDNLSAAWSSRASSAGGGSAGGGSGEGSSEGSGSDSGEGDSSQEAAAARPGPRLGGLSAFSTVKVKDRGAAPRASSGTPQPKDPQVVVRRKKPKMTNE